MNDTEPSAVDKAKTCQEMFEAGRMDNLRCGFPILGPVNELHPAVTWLDKVQPDELLEAADEIIMAHAARSAIKSIARVEAATATRTKHRLGDQPVDALVNELLAERDRAVDFYQEFRERKAKAARIEALAAKASVIRFPKKAQANRPKLRKVGTA